MRLAQHLRRWRSRPLRRLETREFTVNGDRVRVHLRWELTRGQASDHHTPTFVLLHGLGVSSASLVGMAELLSERGRVVMFDLPGFAGLPVPRTPLTIGGFAEVVRESLERLGLTERPVLVGHSMGTQVAAELLASGALGAREAMLVAPVVNADERSLPLVVARFLQSGLRESPGNAMAALSSYVRFGPSWALQTMPNLIAYPIEERLAGVDADLLVVRGDHDALVPAAWAERLATAVTRGRVITLPGAAHGAVFDHGPQLVEQLLALVEGPDAES